MNIRTPSSSLPIGVQRRLRRILPLAQVPSLSGCFRKEVKEEVVEEEKEDDLI